MDIGNKIKTIRINKGITQKELAEKIGFSPVNVSQLENGNRTPNIDTLKKLSNALGVSLDELLSEIPIKELNSAPNIQTVKEPDWEETFSKIKNLAARLQNPQLKNTVEAASAEISDMAKEIYKKQKELIKDFNLYIINSLNADGNLIAFEFLSKLEKNPKYTTPDEARTTSEQREKEE